LLMHDRQWTSEAMGTIVDSLIEKGYLIINPSEIDTQGDNDEL
ncbi:MAG TPA: polysaccharide deacetylase family protein, partial [Erysipelothrix sp.]|nr:polysaccharide deacetylase family protein [Erysipelothrix sp.]